MINRVLLRIKVIQILYAYYKGEDQDYSKAESELKESIEKTYDLYFYLLLLIPAVTEYAKERIEISKKKELLTGESHPNEVDEKFIQNKLSKLIAENNELLKYADEHKLSWERNKNTAVKAIYDAILGFDLYQKYCETKDSSFEEDKELWKKIFKQIVSTNEVLGEVLEEDQLYWNANEDTIFDFAFKTIKKYKEEDGENHPLQPMYSDEESKTFGTTLFKNAIYNGQEYNELINKYINTKKWDLSRIAFMDRLIMQTAIAELMSFPSIPVNVTLNEYIEIAKSYSTEKSGVFVNGVLDAIVDELRKSGKLMKVAQYTPNN